MLSDVDRTSSVPAPNVKSRNPLYAYSMGAWNNLAEEILDSLLKDKVLRVLFQVVKLLIIKLQD